MTQIRDLLCNKPVDARVLQADAVENSHRGLRDTRRRISQTLGRGQTLDTDAAQLTEIIKLTVFVTETKGTGCGCDRILEFHTAEIDAHISHYHSTSLESNTGPSLQTCPYRVSPFSPLSEHAQTRQAPMPHPMRSSMET